MAKYVEQKAREYGLEDVRYIPLKYSSHSWTPELGELWLIAPTERRLAFSPEVAVSLADYSRTTDVASAELVDVGGGTTEADYAGKDVSGKVVLSHGAPADVMKQAVWARGALGIITFTMSRRERIDQVPWQQIPVENDDKTKQGTFGFVLSQREGLRLRAELAAATSSYRVRAKVVSAFREPASQAIVEAVIRGSSIHDQAIVLTGHLQEERFSANDDASGCANVLEIARTLKRLIDSGRLPRPARDIRFWWANEISAEEQYFADHPEERSADPREHQPRHGRRQAIGWQPRAVRDAAARVPRQFPRRRRRVDRRGAGRWQHVVSRGGAGAADPERACQPRPVAVSPPTRRSSRDRSCRGWAPANGTTRA